MDVLALTVNQHQIRPFTFSYLSTIVKIECRCRVFRYQTNRLRQRKAIVFVSRDPEGGVKQAGLGREGSRHGMEAYTDLKYICRDAA